MVIKKQKKIRPNTEISVGLARTFIPNFYVKGKFSESQEHIPNPRTNIEHTQNQGLGFEIYLINLGLRVDARERNAGESNDQREEQWRREIHRAREERV